MVTIVDSIVGSVSGALSNRLLLLLLTVSKDRLNGLGDFGRRCMQSVLLLLLLSSVALVAGLAMPSIGRNELGASSMIGGSGELLLLLRAASDTELDSLTLGRNELGAKLTSGGTCSTLLLLLPLQAASGAELEPQSVGRNEFWWDFGGWWRRHERGPGLKINWTEQVWQHGCG